MLTMTNKGGEGSEMAQILLTLLMDSPLYMTVCKRYRVYVFQSPACKIKNKLPCDISSPAIISMRQFSGRQLPP